MWHDEIFKYAYADAYTWLYASAFDFTYLFLSITWILLFCTWSPGGEWPLSFLGDSLLLRFEFVPMHEWRVYFSWPSHRSIPLKSVRGLAQIIDSTALAHCEEEARYVSFCKVLTSFFILGHDHDKFMHMLHIIL